MLELLVAFGRMVLTIIEFIEKLTDWRKNRSNN
jgi:hypothetical protein